ncbi:hypothetical protein ABIA00_006193 [Bradyrhizobium ottawaense]|uniref:hypothetical protein n=1 Tax=Bradyrhizobium ottawaense TaxID=931866 RepID=UPI003837EAE5
MTKKTKRATKRKPGRPTRRQASAKALKNVDLDAVDPRKILREIAADSSAPAMARMQAARALLNEGSPTDRGNDRKPRDAVSVRAITILTEGR